VKRQTVILLWTGIFVALLAGLLFAEGEQAARQAPGFFTFWKLSKIWVAAGLAIVGTILLMLNKVSIPVRLLVMGIAFFAFGVLSELPLGSFAVGMGLHPSPMCVTEKPFLFLNAGRGIPIIFISIFTFVALLTILSNKSFCAWTCPIGALQELIYRIPGLNKFKTIITFKITNTIRTALFIVFVVLVFAANFTIYEWTNAFHILHWKFEATLIIPIIISIIGAFFIYRPFCYLVCPLGLFTWVLEQFSIGRVKFNKEACTDCKICLKKSPCPTVQSILDQKKIRPDCHACGRCIEVCPEDALKYKV
jgi:polyferredoxin